MPSTLKELPGEVKEGLDGKPLIELVYPTRAVEQLKELCVKHLDADEGALEAIVLASAYVSPVLAIGRRPKELLAPLAVDRVEARVKLDLRGWKLHLRIADYTVLDLYRWSTEHAERLWEGVEAEPFIDERRRRVERDKARYWRIARGEEEPWTFMYYLDLAWLLASREEALRQLSMLPRHEASAGLAIEASVLVRLVGSRPSPPSTHPRPSSHRP